MKRKCVGLLPVHISVPIGDQAIIITTTPSPDHNHCQMKALDRYPSYRSAMKRNQEESSRAPAECATLLARGKIKNHCQVRRRKNCNLGCEHRSIEGRFRTTMNCRHEHRHRSISRRTTWRKFSSLYSELYLLAFVLLSMFSMMQTITSDNIINVEASTPSSQSSSSSAAAATSSSSFRLSRKDSSALSSDTATNLIDSYSFNDEQISTEPQRPFGTGLAPAPMVNQNDTRGQSPDDAESIKNPFAKFDDIRRDYSINPASIIRTTDSLKAGAKFINHTLVVDLDTCLRICKDVPHCDTAIYQETSMASSTRLLTTAQETKFVCYLFKCAKNYSYKCRFSPHNFYISSVSNRHIQSDAGVKHHHHNHNNHKFNWYTQKNRGRRRESNALRRHEHELHRLRLHGDDELLDDTCDRPDRKLFKCHNQLECIDPSLVCDGLDQCSDASDEKSCQDHSQVGKQTPRDKHEENHFADNHLKEHLNIELHRDPSQSFEEQTMDSDFDAKNKLDSSESNQQSVAKIGAMLNDHNHNAFQQHARYHDQHRTVCHHNHNHRYHQHKHPVHESRSRHRNRITTINPSTIDITANGQRWTHRALKSNQESKLSSGQSTNKDNFGQNKHQDIPITRAYRESDGEIGAIDQKEIPMRSIPNSEIARALSVLVDDTLPVHSSISIALDDANYNEFDKHPQWPWSNPGHEIEQATKTEAAITSTTTTTKTTSGMAPHNDELDSVQESGDAVAPERNLPDDDSNESLSSGTDVLIGSSRDAPMIGNNNADRHDNDHDTNETSNASNIGKTVEARDTDNNGGIRQNRKHQQSQHQQPSVEPNIVYNHLYDQRLHTSLGSRQGWFDEPHLASITIGQEQEPRFNGPGSVNDTVIALMFGFVITGMLVMIVGHRLRSIRRKCAANSHCGRHDPVNCRRVSLTPQDNELSSSTSSIILTSSMPL